MANIDWAVLVVYLAGVILAGLAFRSRQRQPGEFFLAGRDMGWVPVGLSVMATAFSAINYTAFSGEVFSNGLFVVLSLPVFVIVAWPVTRVIMPFYHSMRLCSAYEYLEHRFDVRVRCAASALFILWRLAWMGLTLYVPCRVLASITGLPLHGTILIAGGVATLYTLAGGMRAVMWTDVIQFLVLFAGLVVALVASSAAQPGGLVGLLRTGVAAGLARPFYPADPQVLAFDPTVRITLWSALIGTFVAFLARYGADQVVVQRYFTARTLRDARRGFHLNYAAALVTLVLLALMGFAIYAHAERAGTLRTTGMRPIDHFASFVMHLPRGVCGLIVAGLFAATMSSIDSGINSCAAAFATDFWTRLRGHKGGEAGARLGRILVVVFGGVAVVLALHAGRLGTVFEVANKVINALGSPLLALLLLGMFSRSMNAPGMLAGGIVGAAWSIAAPVILTQLALHYYAVVNLAVTVGACYAGSAVAAALGCRSSNEQLSWTWSGRRRLQENTGAAS